MIRSHVALVLAIAAVAGTARSQPSATEDLQSIAAAHKQLSRYDLEITVTYEGSAGPSIHANVKCLVAGSCLRSTGGLSILETPRRVVAVDSNTRTITKAERDPALPTARATEPPDKLLEAWLKTGATVTGGELTDAGRHWIFAPANPRQPRAELFTDPGTHLLRQIIYYAPAGEGKAARVNVAYDWHDSSKINISEFEEAHYFLTQEDGLVPTSRYAGYKIIRAAQH